jgi:hypothetical protein
MEQIRNNTALCFQLGGCLMAIMIFFGCKKNESIQAFPAKPVKVLQNFSGRVLHLYSDTVYVLSGSGPFVRNNGEQLIIDEGTLIKVNAQGAPAGITINQGAVIVANGTRNNPIIFTSNDLTGDQFRNWSGITINGRSVDNSAPGGATDLTDFSGTLRYVRVEFAGLVFNRVGSRSIVENVQVSYSNPEPSFKIQGGSFNARYLVSYACGGAADFHFSNGYSAGMQFLLAYRHPFFGGPGAGIFNTLAGLFIETNTFNPLAKPVTYPVISNLTVIGPDVVNGSTPYYKDTSAAFRTGALVTSAGALFRLRNCVFAGFTASAWYLDDSTTANALRGGMAEMTRSVIQAGYADRATCLMPRSYRDFNSDHFMAFTLDTMFHNRILTGFGELKLNDPFNYDAPDPFPSTESPLLTGAGFEGAVFSNPFFTKTSYIGALGTDNWLSGWTNFIPLKTNYNIPQ